MTSEQGTIALVPSARDNESAGPRLAVARRAMHAVASIWSELGRAGRLATVGMATIGLTGLVASSVLALQARDHLLVARAVGIDVVADAIAPEMPPLRDGVPLSTTEMAAIAGLRERFLPHALFVKIWSLDGQILYADDATMIGRWDSAALPHLERAMHSGAHSRYADDSNAIAEMLQGDGRLVEHYVSLHDDAGRPEAVLKAYEALDPLNDGFRAVQFGVRISAMAGIALLMACGLVVVRSRHRARAAVRDREFELLSEVAEATGMAMEPSAVAETLRSRLSRDLGLSRFQIVRGPAPADAAFTYRLQDGTALVADRREPIGAEQRRILDAAGRTLDVAITNQRMFDVIRAEHDQRGVLAAPPGLPASDRSELVGELHDTVGAELMRTLYAVRRAGTIGASNAGELHAAIRSIEAMVEDTEAHLRAFMAASTAGSGQTEPLADVVASKVLRFEQESGMRARYRAFGDLGILATDAAVLVERTVDEALINVLKHTDARRVTVALLVSPDVTRVRVSDDGIGPQLSARPHQPGRGIGLSYLRQRVLALGGTVQLTAARPRGTRLEVSVPTGGAA
jgi:signal transduction histidine kinase